MLGGARVHVVVPAYNEARLIARTLRAIPPYVDRVIVVDDASTDETAPVAIGESLSDARVHVVTHGVNRGVGAAIATGYRAAFAAGADIAVVMAGDGQMDPADLDALVAPVAAGLADYSKGDRFSYPGSRLRMPLARWIGGHLFSSLTRVVTGLRVWDSQCGYTALSRRIAERIELGSLWPRYGYPNDLLGRLAIVKARIVDVTVRPVYADEKSGLGLRHALFVVPYVLTRVLARRIVAALRPRAQSAAGARAGSVRVASP